MEQLQSHIYTASSFMGLNICAFPHTLGNPSSYMTLQLLLLNFLICEENLIFFFISELHNYGIRYFHFM
jgi:hypothetical protein